MLLRYGISIPNPSADVIYVNLAPGLVNGPEMEEGEEDNDIDDDKDSGNGSVLEYVPQSEFQVSLSSLFLVWD